MTALKTAIWVALSAGTLIGAFYLQKLASQTKRPSTKLLGWEGILFLVFGQLQFLLFLSHPNAYNTAFNWLAGSGQEFGAFPGKLGQILLVTLWIAFTFVGVILLFSWRTQRKLEETTARASEAKRSTRPGAMGRRSKKKRRR